MNRFLTITVLIFSFFVLPACNNRPSNSPGNVTAPVEAKPETKKEIAPSEKEVIYTCPMHPEVESKTPGNCPKCGMKLVPKS